MRRSKATLAEKAVVAGLLVVALALRGYRLGDANLWWDEALAVWAVRKTVSGVTLWTAGDVHPPLFFWLMWSWSRLVGEGEFVLRWSTALSGVALVAVSQALGRRLGGRDGGIAAAALVAASPLLVWWSMELRMYTLAALFGAGALYAALRWTTSGRRRDLAAYVLLAAAATHTVYLAAVLVAAVAIGIALELGLRDRTQRGRRRLGSWLAAQGALAALHIPWLLIAGPRLSSWSSLGRAASPGFVAQLWFTLLATGRSTDLVVAGQRTGLFWSAAVLAAAVVVVGARRPRQLPRGAWSVALLMVMPPVAVWAATQPRSLFYTPSVEARYFVPFGAPALVAVAVALAGAWRRRPGVGAILAVAAAWTVLVSLPGVYRGRRWTDGLATMAQAIWTQAEAGDVVVLVSGNRYPLFLAAYDRRRDPGDARGLSGAPPDRPPVVAFPDEGGGPIGDRGWEARLSAAVEGHPRVWLVEVQPHLQDPQGRVEEWLAARRKRVLSEGYGSDAVHLFGVTDRAPAVGRLAGPVHLEEAGQRAWSAPARAALPGDEVNVVLFGGPPSPVVLVSRGVVPGPGSGGPGVSPRGGGSAPGRVLEVQPVAAGPPAAGRHYRRYRASLAITGAVPGGRYDVALAGKGLRLATLEVRGSVAPARRRKVGARFGPLTLAELGWRPERPRTGGTLAVDALWAAPPGRPVAPGPVVFVHLLGPPRGDGGSVWAGRDQRPSGGPWSSASSGLFDRHLLDIDATAPPGLYTLEVGLYDPATGDRWQVAGPGADAASKRVVAGEVEIVP